MAFIYEVKKGDTLNAIAQRYGFSNYKTAGISSVPSGDFDLIRPGEKITLQNYNAPTAVPTITEGSPVVSSADLAAGFKQDEDTLGTKEPPVKKDGTPTKEILPPTLDTGRPEGDKAKPEKTGDAFVDAYNKSIASIQTSVNESNRIAKERAETEKRYYDTALASIDATVNATIQRIGATYDKRVAEQQRINQLNIDRAKAYGLATGAQFTPIEFGDAISLREQEASDKISELENQRNSLIAEAKAARDKGEAGLLREKMDNLNKIEDDLRKTLNEADKAADAQYKLFRDLRKEQEAKIKADKEELIKKFAARAEYLADKYKDLKPEEKVKFVNDLVTKGWGEYFDISSALEKAVRDKEDEALKKEKTKAEIEGMETLAASRRASAKKTEAETARIKAGGAAGEYTDTELRKLRQAGLENAPTNIKDDYLYGDELEQEAAREWKSGAGGEDDPLGIL